MPYWMAVAGTLEKPLPDEWRVGVAKWEERHGLVQMLKGSQPSVRAGDRLVMYASGTPRRLGAGRFFAVREVLSDPELSMHERWPSKVVVRDIIVGPDLLVDCPTIDEIGIAAKSLRKQTHIYLDDQAGVLAEELLERSNRDRGQD